MSNYEHIKRVTFEDDRFKYKELKEKTEFFGGSKIYIFSPQRTVNILLLITVPIFLKLSDDVVGFGYRSVFSDFRVMVLW